MCGVFLPGCVCGVVCHYAVSCITKLRVAILPVLRSLTSQNSAGLLPYHGRRHRDHWVQTAPIPPARYMLGLAPNWGQTSGIVCGSLYSLYYTCVVDRAACGLSDIVSVHGVLCGAMFCLSFCIGVACVSTCLSWWCSMSYLLFPV